MGHLTLKDGIYHKLGEKIDNLSTRSPWNDTLYQILKELFSHEEADVLLKMPYSFSTFQSIIQVTHYDSLHLKTILESLCYKGLVIDLWINGQYYYQPSPMMIGIFESTMMRGIKDPDFDFKKLAALFREYMLGSPDFANANQGRHSAIFRTMPHEEAIMQSEHIQVYDYESIKTIIEQYDKFAIGLCSCRHQKYHLGEKKCDAPMDNCSIFGVLADSLIRNHFAVEVSKTQMLENIQRSKELGLMLNADNVKKNVMALCHCCKCCCNLIAFVNHSGYTGAIITSNFMANIDYTECTGCGRCVELCPVNAIKTSIEEKPGENPVKRMEVNKKMCMGCGICGVKCHKKAINLVPRGKRVITPETIFEQLILKCLELGTLQNQLFDNPQDVTHKFMRAFLGGFLKLPPVKRALLSNMFRSTFLDVMKVGAKSSGKGWITEL